MIPKFESINCICPLYAGSDRGRANLIGTATLLDFGMARFLVTAAHVHDEYIENNNALYIAASGPLLELPQPFQVVAVRIHLVLAAIAKVHPDLEKIIPTRLGFKGEISIVPWKPLSRY